MDYTPALKELASRIQRLSFREMQAFTDVMSKVETSADRMGAPLFIAKPDYTDALLGAAEQIVPPAELNHGVMRK